MLSPEKIKIVFFDIDETLYIKDKQQLPSTVLPALKQLKNNGIIPAIATGRALCALPEKIDKLIAQLPIDLFVSINGQYNCYQGNEIATFPLVRADIERLITFFHAQQIDYAFVGNDAIAVNRQTARVDNALRPITTRYIIDSHYYVHHDVYQLLAFYDASQDDLIARSGVLQESLRVVRWHDDAVDVLSKTGSKARGIHAVLAHFNLRPENAVAFGDGLNDIEMISAVGFGVAMGNAHPALKAKADYICDNIEQDGIKTALLHLGLITQS
ncbi:Cof-type HAD-IIB family hydrolase [Spirabiliibacterium falconis]|uniref:Cof-type HAD-IIB family hydrolase n=1 Tax=Spirabiliibacterium falconis TaxID=572023 RepID=UPI001AADC96F|nr:Cof-type HAD-IIB family hydrolase [Spirabiliibacterium falconis]MBE2894611.1 Cof-type HAD-IIB family hydrolase [Spirabiliibacterium falconis]